MNKNSCIKCDVCNCVHHAQENFCSLGCIKITCDTEGTCTRCQSYSEKE